MRVEGESLADPEGLHHAEARRIHVREGLVANHHTAACGEPPAVDADAAGTYFGYFTNEYGEQAIYTYDHETGEATVGMGDAGWHDAYRVAMETSASCEARYAPSPYPTCLGPSRMPGAR